MRGDTRALLLRAAAAEFGEHGLKATSMRAVARRAGVDPALVHHYFRCKDELFVASTASAQLPAGAAAAVVAAGRDGVVPAVLVALMSWVYDGTPVFDSVGGPMLALFPFVVMFVVTSVTTLRERQTGTLERVLTTPVGKGDFIAGYACAFGLLAMVQAVVATGVAVGVAGLEVPGSLSALALVAVLVAVLGTTLGLLASAFAATELQAVQFMPALVLPQVLLCGLLRPRGGAADRPSGAVQRAAAEPRCRRRGGGGGEPRSLARPRGTDGSRGPVRGGGGGRRFPHPAAAHALRRVASSRCSRPSRPETTWSQWSTTSTREPSTGSG